MSGNHEVASGKKPGTDMPKWLLYGLIGKGVLVVVITAGVVLWLGGR